MPKRRPKPDADIHAEVAIVGGGLSGLSLAIACATAGIEVAVIDREDPAKFRSAAYDGRTTAIAYGSQQVLRGIGVWEALAGDAEPIREIRVVDGDSPLFLHYDRDEVGAEALGYIVENRLLRGALQARAEALPSLKLYAPSAVADVEFAGASSRRSRSAPTGAARQSARPPASKAGRNPIARPPSSASCAMRSRIAASPSSISAPPGRLRFYP
jgi:2-polyprenyl-6-methoxyphenol hydroxylase-like FAD-dependent oxidoreductase